MKGFVAVAAMLTLFACMCSARVLCGVACKNGAVLLMDNSFGDGRYFGSRCAAPELDAPVKRVSPYLHTALAYGGNRRGLHLLWHRVRRELDSSLAQANMRAQIEQDHDGSRLTTGVLPVRAVATVTQRVIREQPHLLDQASQDGNDEDETNTKNRNVETVYNTFVVGIEDSKAPVIYEISPGGYSVAHSHATATGERRPIALGSSSPACIAIAQTLEQRDPAELEATADVVRCLEEVCRNSIIAERVQRRLMSLAVMDETGFLKHQLIEPNS